MSNLFPPRREYIIELALVVSLIFLIFLIGITFHPTKKYYLDTPVPKEPIITFMMVIVAVLVIYSWWCGGSNHEENVDTNHPDGKLTYPGDKKNVCD